MKQFSALSNFQIDDYFRGRPEYGGTYSKDLLPKKMQLNKFYIFNLDDSTGPGSHWTLATSNSKQVIYFDPFGVTCPVNVLKFMRTAKKPIYYSTTTLQDIKSELCGYYCIYIIEQMVNGRNFVDIIAEDFQNDEPSNDRYIKKYFKNVQF